MPQIDLRLHGKPEDIAKFEQLLLAVETLLQVGELTGPLHAEPRGRFQVLDRSRVYPDRAPSQLGRSYIKVEF